MEGLLDHTLRDVLTRAGGIERCVSEFIRVTGTLLPERVFTRVVPELLQERCTVPLLIEHLRALLADSTPQTAAFASLRAMLGADDPLTPAQRIAALLKN